MTPVSSTNAKRCCLISSASNTPLKCGMYLFGHYAKNPTIRPRTTITMVKDPDNNSVECVARGSGPPRSQDPSVVRSGTSSPQLRLEASVYEFPYLVRAQGQIPYWHSQGIGHGVRQGGPCGDDADLARALDSQRITWRRR